MRGLFSQWMVNEQSGVAACCHQVCTGAFRSAVPQPEEAYFCLRLFLSFEVVWKVTKVQRALEIDDLFWQFWSPTRCGPSKLLPVNNGNDSMKACAQYVVLTPVSLTKFEDGDTSFNKGWRNFLCVPAVDTGAEKSNSWLLLRKSQIDSATFAVDIRAHV